MTIAAGFVYGQGVLLCADSQFTIGDAKMDGSKLGSFTAPWGTVICTFAGNIDYAAGAFQRCERNLSGHIKGQPLTVLEDTLGDYYTEHVFEHPDRADGEYDYNLLLAVKLKTEKRTQLYGTYDTVLREIAVFSCTGIGELLGNGTLRFLYRPGMKENEATALAAYMLASVKRNIQYCGGRSVIYVLRNDGSTEDLSSKRLALFTESVSGWFVNQAEQFMLTHTFGEEKDFKARLVNLNVDALYLRDLWNQGPMPATQLPRRLTKHDWPDQPPSPE